MVLGRDSTMGRFSIGIDRVGFTYLFTKNAA